MDHLNFVLTSDGSKTLFNEELGEHYHSRHGALQESLHVFLNSGLRFFMEGHAEKKVRILEVGFGTGLNFLVTADFCSKNNIILDYTGIEAYPLKHRLIGESGYQQYISGELWESFLNNYTEALDHPLGINSACSLAVTHTKLLDFTSEKLFDLIYFDAFSAVHQPEMWDPISLKHISRFLKQGGVFVTYAITGQLKRTMKDLGFSIEKAAGAPGKREMLRAVKL